MDGPDLAWETLGSRTDYTCPGFDVVRDEVGLPDGTETEFHYLSDLPSVVVLPFTPDGEVVVIEEWRQAVGRVNRGLPAGTLDAEDEALDAAARRELAEETGYAAGDLERLGTFEPANGGTDYTFHYFLARDCRPEAEQDLDDDESIRVGTADYDDLLAAVREGEMRDGRSALGLLYHELFGP